MEANEKSSCWMEQSSLSVPLTLRLLSSFGLSGFCASACVGRSPHRAGQKEAALPGGGISQVVLRENITCASCSTIVGVSSGATLTTWIPVTAKRVGCRFRGRDELEGQGISESRRGLRGKHGSPQPFVLQKASAVEQCTLLLYSCFLLHPEKQSPPRGFHTGSKKRAVSYLLGTRNSSSITPETEFRRSVGSCRHPRLTSLSHIKI